MLAHGGLDNTKLSYKTLFYWRLNGRAITARNAPVSGTVEAPRGPCSDRAKALGVRSLIAAVSIHQHPRRDAIPLAGTRGEQPAVPDLVSAWRWNQRGESFE
jgi:hypothetical protein